MPHEYEFIKHLEGTHIKTFFVSIDNRLYHWHSDMEILLVNEGSVMVHTAQQHYLLEKDDICLVNRNEIHSLTRTKETNTILAIQFDCNFCKAYYPAFQRVEFILKHIKKKEYPEIWQMISGCLNEMVTDFSRKDPGYQLKLTGTLNLMVYSMLAGIPYEEIEEGRISAKEKNLARLNRIVNYIQENYMNRITLKDLAEIENLDMSYMSHFIKRQLGISFQDYVNKIRLEKAVDMIQSTRKTQLDICIECGFSDYRYLNKLFIKEYGCTPSQYKLEYKKL